MIQIVDATEEHVAMMCARGIRRADHIEALRMTGADGEIILHESFCMSKGRRCTIFYRGEAWAMFGVADTILGNTATPWFIAVEGIEAHWFKVAKYSRKIIQVMLNEYPFLENYVDVENTASIRWLQWLGFNISWEATPIRGYPFYYFWMARED